MNKDSKIYIAGHRGLVGSAIYAKLIQLGYKNIVIKTSQELDLRNPVATWDFFNTENPEYVFFTAARAGGVLSLSTKKFESLVDNMKMEINVIESSHVFNVKKLLFIGSNCMYPKLAMQPLKEEYLFAGKLEPTTEFYAIAKLAGVKMCQAIREQYGKNFITAIPVNLYGENDSYDRKRAHVMPALLSKFKEAKEKKNPTVEVWGSGTARREFMHAEDLADACLFLMKNYDEESPVNVGAGSDVSVLDLAIKIKELIGYDGDVTLNYDMPNGIESKLLDSSKLYSMGWKPKISLEDGIMKVYNSL